jgi:hypothetical protein
MKCVRVVWSGGSALSVCDFSVPVRIARHEHDAYVEIAGAFPSHCKIRDDGGARVSMVSTEEEEEDKKKTWGVTIRVPPSVRVFSFTNCSRGVDFTGLSEVRSVHMDNCHGVITFAGNGDIARFECTTQTAPVELILRETVAFTQFVYVCLTNGRIEAGCVFPPTGGELRAKNGWIHVSLRSQVKCVVGNRGRITKMN